MTKSELQQFNEAVQKMTEALAARPLLLCSKEHEELFKDNLPEIEIHVVPESYLPNSNTVYLIPAEQRPIRLIYEQPSNYEIIYPENAGVWDYKEEPNEPITETKEL